MVKLDPVIAAYLKGDQGWLKILQSTPEPGSPTIQALLRMAESLSGLSGPTTILSVIAAGPPATQRLNFRLLTDFGRNRKAAERLAGIASRK